MISHLATTKYGPASCQQGAPTPLDCQQYQPLSVVRSSCANHKTRTLVLASKKAPSHLVRQQDILLPMDTLADRLNKALAHANKSQTDLARAIKVSPQAIQFICAGNTKRTRYSASIAKALGVNADWLENGVGDMLPQRYEPNVIEGITLDGIKRVPLISYVQAGKWREIVDAYPPGGAEEWVTPLNQHGPHAFALRVVGDSMLPEYRDGDVIVVDPDVSPNPGDCVVAKNHHEEATFKKYRPRGRNAAGIELYELVPLNQDYATLYSDRDNTTIIGAVMEQLRNTRRR